MTLVAPKPGQVQGMHHDRIADTFPVAIICARVGQSGQASVDDLHIVKRLFSDT